MRNDRKLSLTNSEAGILRDICFARMRVLNAGNAENATDLPLNAALSEFAAQQSLLVFLFWHYATDANADGVCRMIAIHKNMAPHETCHEYSEKMLQDYLTIMSEQMLRGGYDEDDILDLEAKIQTFLLSGTQKPQRTLSGETVC